jgi:hypothetical protein
MASVQNTHHQDRLDLGQRLFLLGVFGILVVELVGILVNIGAAFEWPAFLLNVFAGLFIVYLGNWLYKGDKTALSWTRGWVTLMVVVIGCGLGFRLAGAPPPDVAHYVGVTAVWLGLLKLAAYATFAGNLLVPGYVLDYLTAQRGESTTAAMPEHLATPGTPVELTADHVTALNGLAAAMKNAGWVLLAVGLFELVCGLAALGKPDLVPAILNIAEGLAVATLGCLLLPPSKAAQALAGAAQRHMGYVMELLMRLQSLYLGYITVFAALAVVTVCRVMFKSL